MEYLLAVDGGGTKTKILCSDLQGNIVGEGLAGPTNLTATNVGAASFNLREAIRQATQNLGQDWQIKHMVMGLAGMDTTSEHTKARETFNDVLVHHKIANVTLVNDIVIALESGTDKTDAVALIAGTGSNCYARSAEGKEAKVGGMDFLLTDQGSGYAIGRAVLRAAVKSYDGRIEKSILEQLVNEYFHIPSIGELKDAVYNPMLTKSEVAALSKLCDSAFAQGDQVAKSIYEHTVFELSNMVTTAMKAVAITDREVDLVFVGGVSTIPYISEKLSQQLLHVCSKITLIHPENKPVQGALKMALKIT
jgi:N-acetylglucosamine kinase-like BadF-type ATPase